MTSLLHSPWTVAAAVTLVNLPFGFWRAGVRKLSRQWFLAVHVPVLLAIGLRLLAGVPLRLATLPVFVVAFALGQAAGAGLRRAAGPALPGGAT